MNKHVMLDEAELGKMVLSFGLENRQFEYIQMTALAKHFRNIMGFGDTRVENALHEFLNKECDFYRYQEYKPMVRKLVSNSKQPVINRSAPFHIYSKEIERVRELSTAKKQKIAIMMLAVCKIYTTDKFPSKKEKLIRYHERITRKDIRKCLNEMISLGMVKIPELVEANINPSRDLKRDSYNTILFIEEDGDVAITIHDYDEFTLLPKTYEYLFYVCSECGHKIEKKSNRQEYCKECWMEKERLRSKNNRRTG